MGVLSEGFLCISLGIVPMEYLLYVDVVGVSLQVQAFHWLMVVGKISTTDNLRRIGMMSDNILDLCVLCKKRRLSSVFFCCEVAT